MDDCIREYILASDPRYVDPFKINAIEYDSFPMRGSRKNYENIKTKNWPNVDA